MNPTVTVVIPAYNEAETIGVLLEALANQVTTHTFEVIVVDNASTDQTAMAARKFDKHLPVEVITEPISGRGAARAAGFAVARGSIILSTDADTSVPSDWIEHLVSTLEHSDAIAVAGTCRIEDCSPRINRQFNWLQPRLMVAYRVVFRHYWLTGSNFAIKASAYRQAGGFSQKAADMDDIDLGFRVHRVGQIAMTPDVPVTTSGRRFKNGLLRGLLPYTAIFFRIFLFGQQSARRD